MSLFIQGEKCSLAPLEGTEWEARQWVNGVMGNLELRHLFTGSLPMRWIDCQKEWEAERQRGSIQFGILSGGTEKEFIGTTGLYSHRDIYRSWEFRILMWAEHGKGIGTEATKLVTDYAFKRLNAHRVWLGVNAENERAIKTYLKVGYREEGRLRDDIFVHGHYVDAIRMGVLENEWQG